MKQHIPALDGVRGLACVGVVLFHYSVGLGFVERMFSWGWVGVDVFFVLSGFLITRNLLAARGSEGAFFRFYVGRALRLWPAYVVVLVGTNVAVALAGSPAKDVALLDQQLWFWTYTTNIKMAIDNAMPFRGHVVSLNHLWSLAIEEQFYLLWPLMILLVGRARTAAKACVALVVFSCALRTWLMLSGHLVAAHVLMPCRALQALCIGAFLAIIEHEPVNTSLQKTAALTVGVAYVVNSATDLSIVDSAQVREQLGQALTLALGWLFIIFAIRARAADTKFNRALAWLPLRLLGRYSYGLYLYHYALRPAFQPDGPFAHALRASGCPVVVAAGLAAVAGVSASVAVSIASWHLLEQFFLRRKGALGVLAQEKLVVRSS